MAPKLIFTGYSTRSRDLCRFPESLLPAAEGGRVLLPSQCFCRLNLGPTMANPAKNVSFLRSVIAQTENFRGWLLLIATFLLCRPIWIFMNVPWNDGSISAANWGRFLLASLQFDAMTATYLMLPCFFLGFLTLFSSRLQVVTRRCRIATILVILVGFPTLAFGNATYFQFANNVFDSYVFEFFHGNAEDTMITAIEEHGAIGKTLAAILISVFCIAIYWKLIEKPIQQTPFWERNTSSPQARLLIATVMLLCIVVTLRGRIGTRPLQRIDCAQTTCRVLNLGALNPIYSLQHAWEQRLRYDNYFADEKQVPTDKLVTHTLALSDELDRPTPPPNTITQPDSFQLAPWQRTTTGINAVKPDHVFLIFNESYDSWPFLPEYADLGIVEGGKQLGKEGHLLLTYLPGANGSVDSSVVCLQGLFGTNRDKQQELPTSIVHSMKKLGYYTRNINAFGGEWSNAERIANEQGFDEFIGTAQILPGGETANGQLHDATLLNYVFNQLDLSQPSFNFIRPCSYHGPFEVDLEAVDCVLDPIPEKFHQPGMRDQEYLRTAYGHLKYSDRSISNFVRSMAAKLPNSLFIITGDHYGRNFITTQPPIYEGASVPLILYGPRVLEGLSIPQGMAASHVDLATTLIELCAPAGFPYVSVGKNIFVPTTEKAFGVGTQYVIFDDSIVSFRDAPTCQPLPWTSELSPEEQTERIERAQRIYAAYHELGYMMARKSLTEPSATRVATEPVAEPAGKGTVIR